MGLHSMRAMKDSGVEWIGDIPVGWDLIVFKRIFSERSGGAWGEEIKGDDNDFICIRVADFNYSCLSISKKLDYTKRNYPKNVIDKLILKTGDILVEKSGGGEFTPVGRAVIFLEKFPAIYANFIERLRVSKHHHPMFIGYILSSTYNTNLSIQYVKQTTGIQNFDVSAFLSSEYVALPCLNEQTYIASYLDNKCAAIDAAIENQRATIDKLKEYRQAVITEAVTKGLNPDVPMKDSGVEWIGDIPEGWDFKKLKKISPKQSVGLVINPSKYTDENGEVPFLFGANIEAFNISTKSVRKISCESNELLHQSKLYSGDLVTVRVGYPGLTAVILPELNECNCASVMITRKSHNFDSNWLCYVMNSFVGMAQIEIVQYGAAQKQFNISHAVDFRYPVPPLPEQTEIATYLDQKCTAIDSAISKKESLIEKLTEYKKSLIYEAVTGKIEVPA